MKRDPIQYSRLLVFLGLFPLLLLDLFVGLPEGAFAAIGAFIIIAAAVVHFYGNELLAGAGWLVFGASLGFVATVDVTASGLYLIVFAILLLGGLVLLGSQRFGGENNS